MTKRNHNTKIKNYVLVLASTRKELRCKIIVIKMQTKERENERERLKNTA